MAVEHLVLLQTKRTPSEHEIATLHSVSKIPGVLGVTCGNNYTARGRGYNFAIVVRLESKEAEVEYQKHPIHVKVRDEVVKPLIVSADGILAIDYECSPKRAPLDWRFAVGCALGCAVGYVFARR